MRINETISNNYQSVAANRREKSAESRKSDEQPVEVRIEDTLELSDKSKINLQIGAEVIENVKLESSFDFTKRDMFDENGRILDSSPKDIEVYGVLLKNKDVSILYATDSLVGNLMQTYGNWQNNTPAEREASKLLAIRQAEYIAQNYLTEDEAKDYLKVVKEQIDSIGKPPEGYRQVGYTSTGKGGAAIYVQNGKKDTDISDTDRLRMTDKYEEIRAYREKYGVNQEYLRMMSDAIKR